jgi:acetoin utilization deacetylase AcuC-like enzyme
MRTAFSAETAQYAPAEAMQRAGQPPMFDVPARVQSVLDQLALTQLGAVLPTQAFGTAPLLRVHGADYLAFLERAWRDWPAERGAELALPQFWPAPGLGTPTRPRSVVGQLGLYAGDSIAPLMAGTWAAAQASADTALTAQRWVSQGERAAFALCRPPGHHASADRMAGYCYINNAAVAAQAFIDGGAARVAVLDIDYHHGNGTQSIFYERADVFFASIHADPLDDYPYFQGYADEAGQGPGLGFNLNCPLPLGAGWSAWSAALEHCCQHIARYQPTALVVSLGVDAHRSDPSGSFQLVSDDFTPIGQRLGALGLPTLFVFEGGYSVPHAGLNVVNTLQGFEAALRQNVRA